MVLQAGSNEPIAGPRLFKTAATDQDGHFTMRGLPPGPYKIFAWEELDPFAYFDPERYLSYGRAEIVGAMRWKTYSPPGTGGVAAASRVRTAADGVVIRDRPPRLRSQRWLRSFF